ncbi:MAG: hypothetical protein KU29_11465 [Sulfurovum sp. FS06-10]|jgi:hypothetical protein|nr:MAG: hypothetical protein KU29_11465 [Sulfurovum sp. FS06-10]
MQEETKEILLSRPIEIDGKKTSTLVMRRPIIKDLFLFGGNEAEAELRMMAHLCGLMVTIEEMYTWDASVYMHMKATYSYFLGLSGK